jgi:serine transporter
MSNITTIPGPIEFIATLILTLPVIVFAFNYSPIVSTFSLYYLKNNQDPKAITEKLLWRASVMLFIFTTFFVFSCILSTTPEELELAKTANMNILTYMGHAYNDRLLLYINPVVAIIAMGGCFLGVFFGARESIIGLIEQKLHQHKITSNKLNYIAIAILFIPAYILAILDAKILSLMSLIIGPIIAGLLFIFPMYATYKIPELKNYTKRKQDKFINYYIMAWGVIGCSAIVYSLFF